MSEDQVDAINQVFELFRINYHNQYYSAYSNIETLNQAKRLWLETLSGFEPTTVLRGAKRAIESSEYLPTLNRMLRCCQGEPSEHGLPDTRNAYVEACRAPSPKTNYAWSHPAVYHAGRAADWYFLASNPEKIAFPVFEQHYQRLCARVINGEQLQPPSIKALPKETETRLSKAENRKRLQALRQSLQL
ncbi:MAG: replication protein P [Exilibacterium sp.]